MVLLQFESGATLFYKTEFMFRREPESEAMYLLDQILFFKVQLSTIIRMYQWAQLSVMLQSTQEDSLQLEQLFLMELKLRKDKFGQVIQLDF